MLSFAPCLPVPQYAIPFHANATICKGTVSYRCLNQGVDAPSLPCVCFSVKQRRFAVVQLSKTWIGLVIRFREFAFAT